MFVKYLKGEAKFEDLRGIVWLDKTTNEPKLAPYAPIINELDPVPIPKWDLIPIKKYQDYSK